MRADRLLKLADFLETVPRKVFKIQAWEYHPATKPEGNIPGECGFAGCAVGWAAHSGMFPGLTLKDSHPYYRAPGKRSGHHNGAAIFEVFGITGDAVTELFMPSSYMDCAATPKQVARRIRKFVRDHTPTGTTP